MLEKVDNIGAKGEVITVQDDGMAEKFIARGWCAEVAAQQAHASEQGKAPAGPPKNRAQGRAGVVKALLVGLLLGALGLFGPQAQAAQYVLEASGDHTAAGQGAAIPINGGYIFVAVNLSTGSGTVTAFYVYLQASPDGGTTWAALPCQSVQKENTTTNASDRANIVQETTMISAATAWGAMCFSPAGYIRAAWYITGTGPHETFAVRAETR
jgi:hypothetical protein